MIFNSKPFHSILRESKIIINGKFDSSAYIMGGVKIKKKREKKKRFSPEKEALFS